MSASSYPRLQVDTSHLENPSRDGELISNSALSTPSRGRERSVSVSQLTPDSFRDPASPGLDAPLSPLLRTAIELGKGSQDGIIRLVASFLEELQSRPTPPSAFDAFQREDVAKNDRSAGAIVATVRGVVAFQAGRRDAISKSRNNGDDSDDENDPAVKAFSTEVPTAILVRLRSSLLELLDHGWRLDDSSKGLGGKSPSGRASSPFNLRRRSLRPNDSGRRSRSPSPSHHAISLRSYDVLSDCIAVLSSIILEDCRFQTPSPSPFRPPNALQSVALDIAQILATMYRHDAKILSQIGIALMPAFASFKAEMYSRLLALFNDFILRYMLDDLRRAQGVVYQTPNKADEVEAGADFSEPATISIQVDAAQEDHLSQEQRDWVPWTKAAESDLRDIPSTNAPSQSLSIYYLSSLVAPLIAAIGESMELDTQAVSTVHRFYRLFDTIVNLKRDASLDVLQVAAYHTLKARRFAISLLVSFWPKALGHTFVSKPFPVLTYRGGVKGHSQHYHPYAHQFVPWRFTNSSSIPAFESSSAHSCRSCSTIIRGFGLLCPFCLCSVHFDCYDYPDGISLSQYTLSSDPNRQKVAMHRFCHLLPTRLGLEEEVVRKGGHVFRAVNIFTLSLCFICHQPLWGCNMQGLRCGACNLFLHSSCLSDVTGVAFQECRPDATDTNRMTILWSDLRNSFKNHYRDLLSSAEYLSRQTYEEVAIVHDILWTQLQIMNNGLALGSIVAYSEYNTPATTENELEEFEIHALVRQSEDILSLDLLRVSPTLDDYLSSNKIRASEHSIFYDWSTLVYVSSVVKSPSDLPSLSDTSHDLLNVTKPNPQTDEGSPVPFQTTSLGHIRDVLGHSFRILSDVTARLLLSHMHHLGFFERLDLRRNLFDGTDDPTIVECSFPLPLGLDESADTDIENLIAAIEVCLTDLDLSMNEVGFLLLVRKLWPSGMMLDYAQRRLCRSVLSWILAEDDNLASILRDCVAQGRSLPGVRSNLEAQPWPSAQGSRPIAGASTHNGGDYVACRRALLHQYATRWMLALHNLDPDAYADMMYEICADIAEEAVVNDELLFDREAINSTSSLDRTDRCLRLVMKLAQASATFTVLEDLVRIWLQRLPVDIYPSKPLPALQRLFNREGEGSHRYSSFGDASTVTTTALATLDPWHIVMDYATDPDQFLRGLRWLCFVAAAGVDVPVNIYAQFASLTQRFDTSLDDSALLARAAMASTWLKSLGRQNLQTMVAALHSRLASRVIDRLHTNTDLSVISLFLRHSLATCLLLFGCERQTLISYEMIKKEEIQHLPSRRKLSSHASMVIDPIIVDTGLIKELRRYVDVGIEQVSTVIAKFLNMLVTERVLLESHEVDNLILRNEEALCACAWQFYDVQHHEIANIRISFLLRILVVDSHPFRVILQDIFKEGGNWELRFQAVTRLFRMILDIINPAFIVDERQYKSAFIDVFYYYFVSMWSDEKEEIRLAVDTWSKSLLPAHFEAIASCWNEALAKAPIAQRVHLVSFLIQLRPHFPGWRVLSWDVIIEIILEDDYMQKNGNNEDGPAAAHLSMYGFSSRESTMLISEIDPEMALLRVSIVLLSLQMIADGVPIDVFSLLRIKVQLLRILGFADVSMVPATSGHAFYVHFSESFNLPELSFPCINELPTVLDASHPFDLAPSAVGGPHAQDESPTSLLVGSIFVDLLLTLVSETENLSFLPSAIAKSLLESLLIVIYKHDFETKPLRHLTAILRKAVRRVIDLLLLDVTYELRQLAVSICQAYTRQWGLNSGPILWESIEAAAKVVSLLHHNGDDMLVVQARSFIEMTLTTLAYNGLFNALCRRDLGAEFFIVLRHITDANAKTSLVQPSLREALLRDTMSRAHENDRSGLQWVIKNLNQYVDIVHHENYGAELMQFVGSCLGSINRRMAELPEAFDPNSLLLLSSTLIEHNKAQSRELIWQLDHVLRACLARFRVSTESLARLLRVASGIYRRAQGQAAGQGPPNPILSSILDTLSDALRRRARITSCSLASMLEIVSSPEKTGHSNETNIFSDFLLNLADDCISYLQGYSSSEIYSDLDFAASRAVARLILYTTDRDAQGFVKLVGDHPAEKSPRPTLTVRAWNILLVTGLLNTSNTATDLLLEHFPTFSLAYHTSLRAYMLPGLISQELTAADVNYAYASIKLWLLLVRRRYSLDEHDSSTEEMPIVSEDTMTRTVWNDLWPPFENLVAAFDGDSQIESPIGSLVLSSVIDLFSFLRQSRSTAALDMAPQMEILNRLRTFARSELTISKLSRVLRSMSEPSEYLPLEVLIKQVLPDMVAAEKLQALETKRVRETGKVAHEKTR